MRTARPSSLRDTGTRFVIWFPSTRPRRTITVVEIRCSTIFCASPPFMRVEPAITSGPTAGAIATSARSTSGDCGIAGDRDAARAHARGLVERREGERRAAAGGDRDHRVSRQQLAPLQLRTRGVGAILDAFLGAPHGVEAAGLDRLVALGRVAEGRRDLGGVEHAHAAAGAGAHVEPAPAALEHEHEHLDGPFDVPEHEADGPRRDQILGVDELQDLARAAAIEIARRLEDRFRE